MHEAKSMNLLKIIEHISDKSGKVMSMLIFAMMGVLLFEVISRYVFNVPTFWVHETTRYIFGSYILIAGVYTLRHRAHVSVDILYRHFSERQKAIVDLATSVFFYLFCGVLLWKGVDMTYNSWIVWETSSTPWGPPLVPLKIWIPIAALLILLEGTAKFIRDFITAITARETA